MVLVKKSVYSLNSLPYTEEWGDEEVGQLRNIEIGADFFFLGHKASSKLKIEFSYRFFAIFLHARNIRSKKAGNVDNAFS